MALQGNLRDFSASEILQLLGTQKKTGCLALERESRKAVVYVAEGRVIATRPPGLAKDDPLLAFLRDVHRLSEEQVRGILTIQRESGRDLEDLLLNGRYLEAGELAAFVERQILDDLMVLTTWDQGGYRFDPHARWPNVPVVRLSIDAVLVEVARRADERQRFKSLFPDPQLVLSVRDLPAAGARIADEERELFGIVDGERTVAEVLAAAPLSEYEGYEALQRMSEAGWIEVSGRRAPGAIAPEPAPAAAPQTTFSWARELAAAVVLVAAVGLLRLAAHAVAPGPQSGASSDVFAAAQVRDLRMTLDLYRRENGRFPRQLEPLADDRWTTPERLRVPGYQLRYRCEPDGQSYQLDLIPDD